MKIKKTAVLLLIAVLVIFFSVPCVAWDSSENKSSSDIEAFLSVLKAWGGFLAKISGSYDVLESISEFSGLARTWSNSVETGKIDPETILKELLRWLGINLNIWETEELPPGSYSI